MMKSIKYAPLLLLLFCCFSCKNNKVSEHSSVQVPVKSQQDTAVQAFSLPVVPAVLTTPALRADYLVNHYWDHFNFSDTNYIHHPEITEQAWVDYTDLLTHVSLPTAKNAIKDVMNRASGKEKKMFIYFTDLADKYLYDPNSPARNEEFYIPVLETMMASPILSDTEKIRPKARLELAQKNRIGTKATDFTYTLASGAKGTLQGLSTEFTLLFFNNPGCHACDEYIKAIKGSSIINKLIADKRLKVLAIYPDEELDEWEKHQQEFPKEWINGYDKSASIKKKNVYDLKAIPSLYLLDKEKMVLLKDVTLPAIEAYFKTSKIE
ncbi:DUF5106 domain-containing protein [uncultured Bacteroides sp.]|uniref:DUF5106 domain-containing protein n=1 Tax=uncultured Bacteroides sp. TaxID=162156 RepID=UPI002AA94914|nr:DUF5106 domain-containing protein [uncultured Bacteroides sp.]